MRAKPMTLTALGIAGAVFFVVIAAAMVALTVIETVKSASRGVHDQEPRP